MSDTIRIDVTGNAEKKLGDIAKESKKASDGVSGIGGSAIKAAGGLFTMEKILQGVRLYLMSGTNSADEMKAAFDRVGKAIVEALADPDVDAALSGLAGNVKESADVIGQIPAFLRFAARNINTDLVQLSAQFGAVNQEWADAFAAEKDLLQQADGDRVKQSAEDLKAIRTRKAEEELAARDRLLQFQAYIESLREVGGLESVISEKREEYLDLAREGNLTEEKKRELLAAIQVTEGEIRKRKQEQIKAEEDARRKAEAEEKRQLQIQEQIEDALWQQNEAQAETAKELADQLDSLADIDRRIRATRERLKDQTLTERERHQVEKDITREVERRGKAMERELQALRDIAKQKEEERQRDQQRARDAEKARRDAAVGNLAGEGVGAALLADAAADPRTRRAAAANARAKRDQAFAEADQRARQRLSDPGADAADVERSRRIDRNRIARRARDGGFQQDALAEQAVVAARGQLEIMEKRGAIDGAQLDVLRKLLDEQAAQAEQQERLARNLDAIRKGSDVIRQRRLQAGMGRG